MGGTFPTSEKTVMHLSLKNMRLRADVIKMIAGLGISPFIMQSTESLCDDHAEYRTSEIRRRPVCWFDVDPDEYHAVDHNSGAGDYTGNPADHQL